MRVVSVVSARSATPFTRAETPVYQGFLPVGDTGIEPVTSAV